MTAVDPRGSDPPYPPRRVRSKTDPIGRAPLTRRDRTPRPSGSPGLSRTLRLTAIQFRYVNKAFWRNPASAFFTFVFPLMFLVIFTSLLGHYTVRIGAKTVNTSTYYVASMASFAVI